MLREFLNNKKIIKTLVFLLEFLFVFLLLYLIFLPLYPEIKYYFSDKQKNSQEITAVVTEVENYKSHLPEVDYAVSQNRLIIPKIGVNAPIVVSSNEQEGLSSGAWLTPFGSTPDNGGNTVITGHRFKYLPPSNLTFYLFHKLEIGDVFSVIWQNQDYFYRIREIKIVDPSDASPYNKSEESILTMYTCHPIYSTEKRLVVISELIDSRQ
jgi:sortase A